MVADDGVLARLHRRVNSRVFPNAVAGTKDDAAVFGADFGVLRLAADHGPFANFVIAAERDAPLDNGVTAAHAVVADPRSFFNERKWTNGHSVSEYRRWTHNGRGMDTARHVAPSFLPWMRGFVWADHCGCERYRFMPVLAYGKMRGIQRARGDVNNF